MAHARVARRKAVWPPLPAQCGRQSRLTPPDDPHANGESAPQRRVKVFDFFSGCGGASRGFQDAGMDVVFALDWDADAGRTFKRNFPKATFESRDIRNVGEEAACLQTVPMDFRFSGSLSSRARQIGNAVRVMRPKWLGGT